MWMSITCCTPEAGVNDEDDATHCRHAPSSRCTLRSGWNPARYRARSGSRRQSCAGQLPMVTLSDEQVRKIASEGALGLLKAGFGEGELARRDSQQLRQQLLDFYADHLYEGTRPYPGMVELITWLNRERDPLGHSHQQTGLFDRTFDGSGSGVAQLWRDCQCRYTVSTQTPSGPALLRLRQTRCQRQKETSM